MKILILFIYLLFGLFGLTTPAFSVETFQLLSKPHPRVFINKQKIEFIKSKITYYPYAKFWAYVQKRAYKYAREIPPKSVKKCDDNTIRGLGNRLPFMAMAYLITGDEFYFRGVKKWINALCSYPHWASDKDLGAAHILFGMAICYDWLYDKFTPEERALYKKVMTKHAKIFYNLLKHKKIWWAKAYLQNHNYTNVMALAITGLALYGEVREAKEWIEAARENFKHVLYWLSPDGASHEGVGYWSYGTEALLKYFMAFAPFYGFNEVKNSLFFQKTAYFRLYMSLPDFKDNVNYADSPLFDWYGPGYILRCLASIFNDGHAQWLAERIEKARGKRALYSWLDLLWYNENIKPIPPNDLPTYAYFDNLGIFVDRTSWMSNSVWVFFKAAPPQGWHAYSKGYYTGSHIHPDEGNFLLWAYGKWLIVDNGYSFLKSTINHNVFLFNGWGQLGEGRKWFNKRAVRKYNGYAEIEYIDIKNPLYKYIIADLTEIYSPQARLKKWIRTWIFLPKGYLIVKDDIQTKVPEYIENFLHLGMGYVTKTSYGFLYKDFNVGFQLYEIGDKPDKVAIEPTVFIGKRNKKEKNSRFTLHFVYNNILKDKCKLSNIIVFKIFHGQEERNLVFLKKSKDLIEFTDGDLRVKIDFLNKRVVFE